MKTITIVKEVVVKKEISVNRAEFKDFEKFLIANDAIHRYARAFTESHDTLDIKGFILRTYCPTQAIDCAFNWSAQPDGAQYWIRLADKWDEWLESKDINYEDNWAEV